MKTLITGATGFIGKSLLDQEFGGEIHTLSRRPFNSNRVNIIQHYGDLKDADLIKKLGKLKFERLIHLAWQGLPILSPEINRLNLNMSRNFIDSLIDSGVQEVNVSGSCLEYGTLDKMVDENTIGINIGDFGETKLKLLDYLESQLIPYRWFRVFYAYGPFQHINSLLMQAYSSAQRGSSLIANEPNESKDFIFVSDVARAISMLLQTKDAFGIFNIGSGKSTSLGTLINTLNQEMNVPAIPDVLNLNSLRANHKKIQDTCGWAPTIDIGQGVSKFIQWAATNAS
jgi:dTDP-6-deoxy-L-talose 4-dehydrogenase (NAD+)